MYDNRKLTFRITLFFIILLLAACSTAATATPVQQVSTPAVVAGSADSVDSSSIALSQVAQLRNGNGDTLVAQFPGNWVQGNNTETILLVSDAALLNNLAGIPETGQAGVSILAFRDDFAEIIAGETNLTTTRFLQAFIGNTGEDAVRFTSIQPYLLDGREAARSIGQDNASDAIILTLRLEDGFALLVGATARGELDMFEDTMQAILSSVTFDANPEADLTLDATPTPDA